MSANRQHAYSRRMMDTKEFSDVLGPIEGYLRKQCGRPWDRVYSEISKVLGSGSFPIRHVLYQHILPDVLKEYGDFRIDHNGILRERPRKRYRRKSRIWETDRVHITGNQWYVFINGIWYIGSYRKSPFDCMEAVRGRYWSGTRSVAVDWPHFREESWRGSVWVFTKIKQCSKKELRDLHKRRVSD